MRPGAPRPQAPGIRMDGNGGTARSPSSIARPSRTCKSQTPTPNRINILPLPFRHPDPRAGIHLLPIPMPREESRPCPSPPPPPPRSAPDPQGKTMQITPYIRPQKTRDFSLTGFRRHSINLAMRSINVQSTFNQVQSFFNQSQSRTIYLQSSSIITHQSPLTPFPPHPTLSPCFNVN